jgi:AhpD family alkylhydroperoxidase
LLYGQRVSYYEIAPDGIKIMMDMEKYTKRTAIERKLRVSQINGCAYCLNMHTADARKMGETEQTVYCVSAWQECEFYTEAEKIALELASM